MSSSAKDKIDKAKTALIIKYPFFGVLLSTMDIVERDTEYGTMATNGKSIFYNDEFVNNITGQELVGVFLHELMHVVYMHCTRERVGGKDWTVFGIAADLVINYEIINYVKQDLPPGGLYDKIAHNKTVEEVYNIIINDPQMLGLLPLCGHIILVVDSDVLKNKILSIYEATKNQGSIPSGIERALDEYKKSKVNWERLLHRFIGNILNKDGYNFVPPNRRFLHDGLYLPSNRNETIGDVVFVVDTSGSMDENSLTQILAELRKLSGIISKITFMSCDAEIHDVVPIYQINDVTSKVKFMGGGGTDFTPAFNKINEMHVKPELVIYATDTYGTFPTKTPKYPVLWVSTVNKERASKIPFGMVVYME